jgi:hypothetical protein
VADETLLHLNRLHADSQSKYVYFLLAATGASLAYGLQKLDGVALTWWVSPGLFALALWLLSLFSGCKYVTSVQSAMYSNYLLLQLQQGTHPAQPRGPQETQIALEITRQAIDTTNNTARTFFRLQFWLLSCGVLIFTMWRVLEMARLTFYAP